MLNFDHTDWDDVIIENGTRTVQKMSAKRGNTATEYSLVGASVLVATVGLWFLLGGGLSKAFAVLKAEMQVRGIVVGFAKFGQTIGNAMDVKGTDGRVIEVGPQFLGAPTTQTAGTSGNTADAYKQLKALWAKSVEEGKMTEEEAANLDALAQQALKLAQIQKAIETAMAQVGYDNEILLSLQVQLDGEGYTVAQLAEMIGWKENTTGEGNPLIPDSNANGLELNKLKELYQQAEKDGALNDPAVKALVSQLTEKVADFSDVSQDASDDVVIEDPTAAQEQYEENVEEQLGDGTTSTSDGTQDAGEDISTAP